VELNNSFEVDRPIGEAWALLTDIERIAPCMPGAQLEEIEGDEFRGSVKVKVGPITAQYKGAANFLERDDSAYKAVIKGSGRDSRGQGNASALITAQLTEVGGGKTKVDVNTDLQITGKVAQFGRGVIGDVSEKLLGQFVDCLQSKILAESTVAAVEAAVAGVSGSAAAGTAASEATAPAEPAGAAPAASIASSNGGGASPGVRKIQSTPVEPVDLLDATGAPLLKRLGPLLAAFAVLLVIARLLRRRG
jgi:hypothetical protein